MNTSSQVYPHFSRVFIEETITGKMRRKWSASPAPGTDLETLTLDMLEDPWHRLPER